MKRVLITGASVGLGKDFAHIFAKEGYELVVVARSQDKLDALAKEIQEKYRVKVVALAQDLASPGAAQKLNATLKTKGLSITSLVNNAGFANNGAFADTAFEKEVELLHLNVNFLVEITHLLLQDMRKQKFGEILNVASTAGFLPGPMMTNYYASKAYVLSFSEGLAEEVADLGIRVSVLCPGPTKTEFFSRANMDNVKLAKTSFLVMDSYEVAKMGYDALKSGQVVKIAGFTNFFQAQSVRISPRFLVRKIAKFLNQK